MLSLWRAVSASRSGVPSSAPFTVARWLMSPDMPGFKLVSVRRPEGRPPAGCIAARSLKLSTQCCSALWHSI